MAVHRGMFDDAQEADKNVLPGFMSKVLTLQASGNTFGDGFGVVSGLDPRHEIIRYLQVDFMGWQEPDRHCSSPVHEDPFGSKPPGQSVRQMPISSGSQVPSPQTGTDATPSTLTSASLE